jgi:hypothetical protein
MSVRISVDRVKGFALIVSVRIEPSTDVYIYKLHNKRIKELKKNKLKNKLKKQLNTTKPSP